MIATMTKEGGAGIMKESINNFSSTSIEGVTKKGDVMHPAADMKGALAKLKEYSDGAVLECFPQSPGASSKNHWRPCEHRADPAARTRPPA